MTPAWSPPRFFEEYQLIRMLGQGAMGRVWLVRDVVLDREVAIKFVAAENPDPAMRDRFLAEARAVARLRHPNVMVLHRVGEVQRHPFLVSEYLHGCSLDQLPLPIDLARGVDIAVGLARGLAAAHRRGVLHRDIKPANAFLTDEGEVKLLDFGLALLDPQRPRVDEPVTPRAPPIDAAAGGGETLDEADPLIGATADGETGAASELALVGTPQYLAPEIWAGEPESPRSDVYGLGATLYELFTGTPPHVADSLAAMAIAVQTEAAPLASLRSELPPALAQVIDRCLRRLPGQRFGDGEELRKAIEAAASRHEARRVGAGGQNPYRGLRAFEADDRGLFFGREGEVRAVVERLRSEPWVVLIGSSGAGKSSLARAGVIPLILDGALRERQRWRLLQLLPGTRPVQALVATAAAALGRSEVELARLVDDDPSTLARLLRADREQGTLVFVDQLEELVTLSSPAEAQLAAEVLTALALPAPGIRLLAAARSDFLDRLAALPALGDALSRTLELLRPLSPAGLRDAVVGPAEAQGVRFESEELVERLVAAGGRTEGGLPLLQFALAELWEARNVAGGCIGAAALERIGGVEGALTRSADGVLARLLSGERAAARRLLMQLVTADGTRARCGEAELIADGANDARTALEALVRGRLVIALSNEDGHGAYELAHEALVERWETLRRWLDEDAEARVAQLRLARAATEWERLGRPREALLGPRQLAELERIGAAALGPREARLLQASRRARRAQRLRRGALALATPLLLAAAVAGVRLQSQRGLERAIALKQGQSEQLWTTARAVSAAEAEAEQRSFAAFDALDWSAGESVWPRAIDLAHKADYAYVRASAAMEGALALDPRRPALRAAFAEVTLERVLLAERQHRATERDELLARLRLYDDDGARRRRLDAPARLSVVTPAIAATVTLAQYIEGDDGRRRLDPALLVAATPLTASKTPPGSYLLAIEAAGRAPVRLPIVLGRGEEVSLSLSPPPAGAVPRDFVYVPRGRFLFGSSDDETARRSFLRAAPLHPVQTEAYLIARHEVTFGDWIAWLRALDPVERQRRMPQARGSQMSVELRPLPGDRWQLRLRPTTQTYEALDGEPIRYPARERRALQDWLRMPVAGISFDDAVAYATWLDATGRVPGARLCDEYEWERAARGAEGRTFPSGEHLNPDDANIDVTYGRKPLAFGPDEVGSHPRSRSPFGVDDLVGNACEWVRSVVQPGAVTFRGGSWYHGELSARANNRSLGERTMRAPFLGLRLCANAP